MVLVDSSVWIAYFKGNEIALPVHTLIDYNTICINDLILAELIPSISQKKEEHLKELLLSISRIPIVINWQQIIHMQTHNIEHGINKVGIADLIIAQNVIEHNLELFSLDKHFKLMSNLHGIRLYN